MIKNLRFLCLLIFLVLNFSSVIKSQIANLEATMSLKKVDGINIPYQNGFPLPSFEKQKRHIINLGGEWKKQRFSANDNYTLSKRDSTGIANILTEAAGRNTSSFNDNSWQNKNIPSVENQINSFPTVPEYYQDGVWYRKSFEAADSLDGKFIKLMFYAVNYVADVWLNDIYLGYHEGGYTPFAFDATSAINFGGNNVLVVRVDNPAWGTRNDIVPYTNVDWFNYTGIIHDVYLEVTNAVSVIRADVVPQNTDGSLQATVTLFNRSSENKNIDISLEIFEADVNESNIQTEYAADLLGSPAAVSGIAGSVLTVVKDSAEVWRTTLQIANPKLWSPKSPDLYLLKVTIKENGNIIDEYFTQFGIRTIKSVEEKVYLNDNPVFFTGVARHEDHPLYGRSIPVDVIYQDLLKVKEVNANMLRTAHYPNHLYTYLIADRLGITIIEEIPVWWFDDNTAWVIHNSLRRIHEQMFREMVFKDYNRPSIILWSTTNECADVTNRKTFIQRVKQDLNANFPDGRLVTQSAAADRPGPEDPSQAACDVAGWTMYFGIFHGGTYYEGTRHFIGYANIEYPLKPILNTEFGYWSGENNTVNGQNTQVTVFNETFDAFTFKGSVIKRDGSYNYGGYLMGVTWWCIFDWYSHQHPQGFQSMGLYTMDRSQPKLVRDALKNGYKLYYDLGGVILLTDVNEESPELINNFSLFQNHPNPFNPSTKIKYNVGQYDLVTLKIYDILGNEISELINEYKSPGEYEIIFNSAAYDLSSGVYFYKLTSGSYTSIKKMILLK